MNKILFVTAILSLCLVSCKKGSWECTCVDNVQHLPTQTFTYSNKTEKDAEQACGNENHNNSNYQCTLTEIYGL